MILSFLSQVSVWLFFYLVVRVIAKKLGATSSDLHIAIEKMQLMQKKMHKHYKHVMSKKKLQTNSIISQKRIIYLLKRDYKSYKIVNGVFNIYLFDNSNDKRVVAIRKEFSSVESMLKDLIVEFMHIDVDIEVKLKDYKDKIDQIDVLCSNIKDKIAQESLRSEDENLRDQIH